MKRIFTITILLVAILVSFSTFATNYYPKSTGNLAVLSTWGTSKNGSGTAPTSFTNTSDVFNVNKAQTASSTWTVHNLTVSSTLTLSSPTIITGTLTLNASIVSNGNLTVDLNTGSILGNSSGSITGNITVTKNIGSNGWHYLGTPLNSVTVAQFNDDAPVASNSCYYYDETVVNISMNQGWVSYATLTSPLTIGNGYILYYHNTGTIDYTGTYTHNKSVNKPVTFTSSGILGLFFNADGWNLVSNPYPSVLNWDLMKSGNNNVNDAIYYWDGANKRYASYVSGSGTNGGTSYIPPLQAFFVQVNTCFFCNQSGTVAFTPSAKVSTPNNSLWRTENSDPVDVVRIGCASNSTFSDETVVRILDDATDTFDNGYDAYKMFNGGTTPSVYTVSNNTNYSINSISPSYGFKDINLSMACSVEDTFNLTFSSTMTSQYQLYLIDKDKNDSLTSISDGSAYKFYHKTTDDSSRFVLRVYDNSIVTDSQQPTSVDKNDLTYYSNNSVLNIQNPTGYDVGVYSIIGELLYSSNNANMSLYTDQNICIIKYSTPKGVFCQKTFINK